jgi:prepilin-type N-terminal cleavage/methylation domain-containing protein
MKNRIRTRKGFTLAEMIISIGVVAIFSVIILQLFITAKNLNTSSRDLDRASSAAVNIAEMFKSSASASEFITGGEFGSSEGNPSSGLITMTVGISSKTQEGRPSHRNSF